MEQVAASPRSDGGRWMVESVPVKELSGLEKLSHFQLVSNESLLSLRCPPAWSRGTLLSLWCSRSDFPLQLLPALLELSELC